MSDTSVEVQFGGDAEGALASMSQVRHALQGLINPVRGIYDNLGELAEAFAAVFAVDKLVEFLDRMGELGEQIERTSAMLGTSTSETQKLGFIAQMTGSNANSMALSMERLQVSLQHAQNPTSMQAQALAALGLSAKQLIGLPLDVQMNKIADAVSRFGDGGNKTAIVMALLGRSGAQMIPVLDKGASGLQDLRDAATNASTVMDGKTVKSLSDMDHAGVTLSASLTALGGTIAGLFAKQVIDATNDLISFTSGLTALIQDGKFVSVGLEAIANAFKVVGTNIAWTAKLLADMAQPWMWNQVLDDWRRGNEEILKIQTESDNKLLMEVARSKLAVGMAMKFPGAGGEGGNKPQAPAINVNAAQGASAAQKDIDAQIKVWEEWLQKQKTIYDESAKTFAITEDQKYALTMAATDKAYQAELALLQKEAQLGDLSVAQHAAIAAKIEALEAKHGTDIAKLNAQSVESMQKQWEGYFSTIEGAFNSNLRGLLDGTATWAQAVNKIIGDLIIKFIEGEEQKLAQHIATEIAETTATTEGVAARTAAETAGNSDSILVTIANAMKSIFASVGQTTAGVTAAVAPVAGPAAPAIGAAAGASTMATALSYIHAETGAWEVGGGPAMLHPGEMVVPRPFADSLRDAGGGGFGGGGDTNINISAVDAQSVRNLFQGNSDIIGSIVQKYVKNNPTAARVG